MIWGAIRGNADVVRALIDAGNSVNYQTTVTIPNA